MEKGICDRCASKVHLIHEPRCKKCGKPLDRDEREFCQDCQRSKHYFREGRSLYLHVHPVDKAIYDFKYKNLRIYGEVFGKMMAQEFEGILRRWKIQCILPIPLHRSRKRSRGYNQAEILARKIGKLTGIPVETHALIRRKKTVAQKEEGRLLRRQNMKHAFMIREGWKPPAQVLLIDDIYTTGSTMDSAAKELLENGCQNVYFLTISIGQGN